MNFRFGPFELSSDGVLRRGEQDMHIAAKPFALLRFLILHRDRFVTRSEIAQAVWPHEHVGNAAFASVLRDARRCLGDHARETRFIATRRGVGFRFVHEVVCVAKDAAPSSKWDELVGLFERALGGLDRIGASRGSPAHAGPPRERGPLLIALARARWGAGATEIARANFEEAIHIARELGDAEMFAQAALGFAGRSDASLGVNERAVTLLEDSIALLGDENLPLASEVAARLGTELYHRGDGTEAVEMTATALRIAEASAVPSAIAYALTARHFALTRPDVAPNERRVLAERAIALVEADPPSDVVALGLQERLADLLEEGDGAEFDATFSHYEAVVARLEQPFFVWMKSILAASRMVQRGELDEALAAANELLARGTEIGSPNAQAAFFAILFSVQHARDRLGELFPFTESFEGQADLLPVVRAALVAVAEPVEAPARFRVRLDALLTDLPSVPRDANWLGVLGILAPSVARAGNEQECRFLYDLLTPFSDRMVVAGHGALFFGAVDHHRGLLAARFGDTKSSALHFDAAERHHARALAPLWLARTRATRA